VLCGDPVYGLLPVLEGIRRAAVTRAARLTSRDPLRSLSLSLS